MPVGPLGSGDSGQTMKTNGSQPMSHTRNHVAEKVKKSGCRHRGDQQSPTAPGKHTPPVWQKNQGEARRHESGTKKQTRESSEVQRFARMALPKSDKSGGAAQSERNEVVITVEIRDWEKRKKEQACSCRAKLVPTDLVETSKKHRGCRH